MAQISRWNDLADEHGFLVVYPMGTGFPLDWRDSVEPGLGQEVAFISGLIDHLEGEYHLDPKRIYVNGYSKGGALSIALSCELSERIAAIGSVAGTMRLPWDECNPSRPEPAIVFHGDADPYIPFKGGPSPMFDFPFPRVDDWVQTLAERNGCLTEPQALPDSGEASGVQYTGCDQGAEVIYYTIHGGGHTWPGSEPQPEWMNGYTTDDIDATRLMWDFFLHHPLE
jgi:polyhydroxybutyrate depolymerase